MQRGNSLGDMALALGLNTLGGNQTACQIGAQCVDHTAYLNAAPGEAIPLKAFLPAFDPKKPLSAQQAKLLVIGGLKP